ncbi:MAG: IS1380 family transposase, partial [Candidatus Aminicenantes bacterium]|nr:IS1380 family transposase [Candidatus Aminicenantes bacterium]
MGTVGDWLVRAGKKGGMGRMGKADEAIAGAILKRLAATDYTLDIDATVIEAEKKEAKW